MLVYIINGVCVGCVDVHMYIISGVVISVYGSQNCLTVTDTINVSVGVADASLI